MRLLIDTLRQVVVVPTAAVQRGPNGPFVYVVKDDNTVAVRPVGDSQQDEVQAVIAQGLEAGERVVTTGFARLHAKVRRVAASSADEIAASRTPAPGRTGGKARRRGSRRKGALRPLSQSMSVSIALHPPPDRDLAARRRGHARRLARLSVRCRSRRCRRSISPPSR